MTTLREYATVLRLMLDRAQRMLAAGDTEQAMEAIRLAQGQLEHTVRQTERAKGASEHG